jgi:hypothetical protein
MRTLPRQLPPHSSVASACYARDHHVWSMPLRSQIISAPSTTTRSVALRQRDRIPPVYLRAHLVHPRPSQINQTRAAWPQNLPRPDRSRAPLSLLFTDMKSPLDAMLNATAPSTQSRSSNLVHDPLVDVHGAPRFRLFKTNPSTLLLHTTSLTHSLAPLSHQNTSRA